VTAATSPDAVPGGYHRGGVPAEPSPDAQDADAGRRLWDQPPEWVEQLAG
jgi:hypothetical protein